MGLNGPEWASSQPGFLKACIPEPEEVFLAWVLACPSGTNLAAAAADEIWRLSQYRGSHPGPRALMSIFEEFLDRSRIGERVQ